MRRSRRRRGCSAPRSSPCRARPARPTRSTRRRLAAAITPRTRLVVLTRPHNPTGAPIDTPTLAGHRRHRRAGADPCAGRRSVPGHAGWCVADAGRAGERALHLDVEPDQGLRPGRPALRLGAGRARRRRPHARRARGRRAGAGARRSAWRCGPSPISLGSPRGPAGSSSTTARACSGRFAGRDDSRGCRRPAAPSPSRGSCASPTSTRSSIAC